MGPERRMQWARVWPLALAAVVLAVFFPATRGAFLAWDDDINIQTNLRLSALTWDNVQWMFTDVSHMRRFVPLTWLGWAIEYRLVGLTPWSTHAGNVFLHALNAVLVWLVVRSLLREVVLRWGWPERVMELGAAAAAGLWALHPLRVEVVAWASGRIYLQALGFLLVALLGYLRAARAPHPWWRCGWYWASVGAFAASVLTYPIALSFAAVLVIVDLYVLRRDARSPALWLEKGAFAVITLAVLAVTLLARMRATGIWEPPVSLAEFGIAQRAMQAFYVWAYYVWKPLVPFGLAPAYTTLTHVQPWAPHFVVSAASVVVATVLLARLRTRYEALWAAWCLHLCVLVPVLGLTEHPHYTNDRYSYLQGIVWAGVVGGAVSAWAARRGWSAPVVSLGAALVLSAILSGRQIAVWRDSETLFKHLYARVGATAYRADVALRLGDTMLMKEEWQEAGRYYAEAFTRNPRYGRRYLAAWGSGRVALALGRKEEAVAHFRESLALREDFTAARVALALALREAGRPAEARVEIDEVLRRAPEHAGARRLRESLGP
jgi:tetratricopeptide (TPR) repeat protein